MVSEPKVTLKILECPMKHQLLREYLLENAHTQNMKIYGRIKNNICNLDPDYALALQGNIWFMLMKHKNSFSWNGDFNINDMEVINENIFIITKPPKKFKALEKLIEAMEKDFLRYAELLLKPLMLVSPNHIPYLNDFNNLLNSMSNHSKLWLDDELAECFRDFIRHHPFLKPPLAIAHLLSDIHTACRAHDPEDPAALFKKILRTYSLDWRSKMDFSNSMVKGVIEFKNKPTPAGEEGQGQKEEWPKNLEAMVEFIRHLFNHGSDYSKEENLRLVQGEDGKVVPYGDKKPQKQLMGTLEETEVAAAADVAELVCTVIFNLVESKCLLRTWLLPIWKTYKSSFSSTPIDERAMEQWDKWLQPEEPDEDGEE